MSRSSALTDFRPSYLLMPVGLLRDGFQRAYADGVTKLQPLIAQNNPATAEGILPPDANANRAWLQFGHTRTSDGAMSGHLPYRMKVSFDARDAVSSIELTLFFLNPRLVLSRREFMPANRNGLQFQTAGAISDGCGLQFVADPADFNSLSAGLPAHTLDAPDATWQQLSATTLLDRLDLSMKWSVSGITDRLGFVPGVPDAPLVGITSHELRFCNLATAASCDTLLHISKRFAITLELDSKAGGIDMIPSAPQKPGATATAAEKKRWDRFILIRREFGLGSDFTGILCDGLAAHYLNDAATGHDSVSLGIGATAFAFSGKTYQTSEQTTKWYLSADLTVNGSTAPIFGVFDRTATLSVSIGDGEFRFVSVKGRFAQQGTSSLQWLSGKDAVLSLARLPWKDAGGADHIDWGAELALVGAHDRIIARLTDADVNPATITGVATALAFGPIVTRMNPADPDLTIAAPDAKTRGYYIDLDDAQSLAALVAGGTFSNIFKNAIHVHELRVVGLYARMQPRQVTLKTAPPEQPDSALLFDYEADYDVDLGGSAGIKTTRSVSTRVDGSGFAFADGFRWVQVPSGILQLSLDDPGLWQLSGLGKFLRIVQVAIRHRNPYELVVRLRLAGNFGIVKADDFVFVLDLTDPNAKLVAYPSEVTIDIPGAVKATGKLIIRDSSMPGHKDIGGALDITIVPTSLRVFGALRFDVALSPAGQAVNALLASAEVEFPHPIPLGASGIALNALEGLYASNFARIEKPQSGMVPPALEWLQRAGGDVAQSVCPSKTGLWKAEYDRWSFGLGAGLGLVAGERLVNLNSMLVVELPGPRITLFSKVNLLKNPKSTKDAAPDLLGGILGLLLIDVPRREITLAALADLEFKQIARIRGAMELFFKLQQLSHWHFYLGTPSDPITVRLELGGIVDVGADLYFMAAGDQLPTTPPLPGFALAFWFHAWSQIGSGPVFLRVDLTADLRVSISKDLFIAGSIGLSGELNLWIVSIGASGTASFEFLKTNPDPPNQLHVKGQICGHVKLLFVKLQGCVTIELGASITPNHQLPPVVDEVSLVANADLAMFGQGLAQIDAKLGTAKTQGDTSPAPPPTVPIDSAIAISMSAPPNVKGTDAFTQTLPKSADTTTYNFGGVNGEYDLRTVRLTRGGQNTLTATTPARWWRNPTPSTGGQPSPLALALLTRNPFGPSNAMPTSQSLDAWIAAIANDPCGLVRPPQECFYRFTPADIGIGTNVHWTRPGELCSLQLEQEIGRSGVSDLSVSASAAVPPQKPQMPIDPAVCAVDSAGTAVEFLKLTLFAINGKANPVAARFSAGGFSLRTLLQVLVAVPAFYDEPTVQRMFTLGLGTPPDQFAAVTLHDLRDAAVQRDFDNGCTVWRAVTEAFAQLATLDRYGAYKFFRADIDLRQFPGSSPATVFTITLRASSNESAPARQSVLIGALKFTPKAEADRATAQQNAKSQIISEIGDLLTNPDVPLLEPSSTYNVEVTSDGIADTVTTTTTQVFTFNTDANPPRKLDPYVLATFPTAGETRHYTGDHPGVVLATRDILRMLVKYGARLRVAITDNLGREVFDSTGNVHWTNGVIFDPARLLDASQPPPAGIDRTPVAALPSAVRDAILKKIAHGELACLGNLQLPASALWLGFDVALVPLTSYLVHIDVVDAAGHDWQWPASDQPLDTSTTFFQWTFGTSLYASTAHHASALARAPIRQRLLAQPLSMPAGATDPALAAVELVTDKLFEDAIAGATGERAHRGGDPQVTLLWTGQGSALTPSAIVIESNEPLVRRAILPVPKPIAGSPDGLQLTERSPVVFSAPHAAGLAGVSRAVATTSGFAMLLVLDASAPANGVTLALGDTPLDRVPRAVVPSANAIVIPPALLVRQEMP
jgi:hypothetical protein